MRRRDFAKLQSRSHLDLGLGCNRKHQTSCRPESRRDEYETTPNQRKGTSLFNNLSLSIIMASNSTWLEQQRELLTRSFERVRDDVTKNLEAELKRSMSSNKDVTLVEF